jgi:hypothetical protein
MGFCIAPSDSKGCMLLLMQEEKAAYTGVMMRVKAGKEFKPIIDFRGRGSDFAEVKVDPKNEDIVYSANVVTWKSIDGGKHGMHSAAHRVVMITIASGSIQTSSDIIIIASDQGAIIHGKWRTNIFKLVQSTHRTFYHVSTDNAFPIMCTAVSRKVAV